MGRAVVFLALPQAHPLWAREIVDQEIEAGGQLAEVHEITFDLKKATRVARGKFTELPENSFGDRRPADEVKKGAVRPRE